MGIDPTYEVNSSYNADAPDPFRAADLNNERNLGMFQYAAPPPPEPEPEKPIAKPIAEPLEEEEEEEEESEKIELYQQFIAHLHEESSSEEEGENIEIYQQFIAHLHEEPSSDEESENTELYERFIAQLGLEDEEEEEVFPEENEILYVEFISQFQPSDAETYSSESDSSETTSEETPAFPESEEEQQLPIIAPRPMIHNHSCDSVLSEDTLNLLHFNRGFDLFVDDDDEDEVSLISIPPQLRLTVS